MQINRRGAYPAFAHDRAQDWDFLSAWQPSVVRIMLPGSAGEPASISVDKIQRIHTMAPGATILLRCWDMDDRNGDQHRAMAADPSGFARWQINWWEQVFDRITGVPRNQLMAGLNNEVNVDAYGAQLREYTVKAMQHASARAMRLGVGMFSTGTPGKPGESEYDMAYFSAAWEGAIRVGDHALVVHEYMQPEGMYAVWTDDQGNERRDFGSLINRHVHWPMQVPIIIGEWGVDGLLYNRHKDPTYGHSGWRNFDYWPPARIADEYVECCRVASPNVVAICQFILDSPDRKWFSFDPIDAAAELLARRGACEIEIAPAPPDDAHNVYVPIVVMDGPQVVTGDQHYGDDPPVEPVQTGVIDPQVLQAILQIESGGAAFGKDGRLTLRFEAHIFKQQLANDALFGQHFEIAASKPWAAQQWLRLPGGVLEPIHTGQQATEYRAFERARSINAEAAYRSVSMGAAQIMGFNHARIGYLSAESMFKDFQRSEAAQIVGFINFMLTNATLMHAVRRKDWRLIAELYNGAGAVDTYAPLLEQAYRERTA